MPVQKKTSLKQRERARADKTAVRSSRETVLSKTGSVAAPTPGKTSGADISEPMALPRFMRHFKIYLFGFILALALFGIATWLALHNKNLMAWEVQGFQLINNLPDSLRIFGLIASIAPESTMFGAAAVVLAFVFKKYHLSWRLAVGVASGSAAIGLVKHVVDRPRPAEIISDVHLRAHDMSMGFPSGHAMMITVIMLMLLPYVPGKWKILVSLPILAVAWSRMYVGLHAPLDIIGGFAIGLGVVCFLRILPTGIARAFRLE